MKPTVFFWKVLDVVEHGKDTRIPGNKKEVVRLLKLHGATVRGTFDRGVKKEDRLWWVGQVMQRFKREGSGRRKGRKGFVRQKVRNVSLLREKNR